MSPTTSHIHLIKKSDISSHLVLAHPTNAPPLSPSHVRVRTAVVSLNTTNLTYAQMGTIRNWWDAYPVPSSLPAPYNDRTLYGIVIVYGYAEVLESRVQGIEAGMLLWGFWPSTSLPTDLELEALDADGQWREVSEGRKGLMNLYNWVCLLDPSVRLAAMSEEGVEGLAWEAANRREAGFLLDAAVFGERPVHPLGFGQWKEEDAELGSAVVVSLSASGNTARSFANCLSRRSGGEKPLAWLGIASTAKASLVPKAEFPTRMISYGDIEKEETIRWIGEKKSKKVVIVDFGGRGDSLVQLFEALQSSLPEVQILIIGVGGNPDLRTTADLGKWAQRKLPTGLQRIQMNTSGIRDAFVQIRGNQQYLKDTSNSWSAFRQSSLLQDVKLHLGLGIAGEDGFEGGWSCLCRGEVAGDVVVAFKI